jgi:hypothetical protein
MLKKYSGAENISSGSHDKACVYKQQSHVFGKDISSMLNQ